MPIVLSLIDRFEIGNQKQVELTNFKIVRIWFLQIFIKPQSTAWIFPLYFQLPCLPEETCFQQAGSSVVEGTSRLYRDLLTGGRRYQPTYHYFEKVKESQLCFT
jgi:hypothetical protein